MGKKKQFDETEVLGQIAEYFWEHGYAATKVDQLAELTGLTKTSLYNAFGNKEALFLQSVELYVSSALDSQKEDIDTSKPLSENIESLLNLLFFSGDKRQRSYGCLLTNSIVELAANEQRLYDEITELSGKIRDNFRQLFALYVDQGALSSALTTDELTDFFMTFMQGLRVISRKQHPEQALKNAIKTYVTLIRAVE